MLIRTYMILSLILAVCLQFGARLSRADGPVSGDDEHAFLEAAMQPQMDPATASKVEQILNNVIVDNSYGAVAAPGKLDVLEYNVEQGLGYQDLELLLSDGEEFLKKKIPGASKKARE